MEDLELEEVCRLCLTKQEDMQLAIEVGAIDQLFDCASVKLPSNSLICEFCKTQVNKWFSFKQQVLRALEVASCIEKDRKNSIIFKNNQSVIEECCIKTEVEEDVDKKADITQIDLTSEPNLKTDTEEFYSTLEKSWFCESCFKIFNTFKDFKNHNIKCYQLEDSEDPLSSQHTEQYQCDLCNKSFNSKVGLTWHKKLHSALKVDSTESTPPFFCPYCPISFEEKLFLKNHIKWRHQRSLKCFNQTRPCDNNATIEEYCIKTEVEEEIDVKPDIIQIEDLNIEQKPESDKEPESTIDYTCFCEICDKPFYTRNGFKNHNKKFHPPEEDCEESPSPEEDDQHQCDLCHKTFISRVGMMWHKKLHSALKLDITEGAPVFSCPYCPMSYEKKLSLIDHMKWKHQRMMKRFNESSICDFCGKYCKSKSEFRAHNKTHKGVKQFKCDLCTKSFVKRQNLIYHRGIHMVTGCPFSCAICGRRFDKKSYLLRHQATHERPHKCDLCNKTFGRKYTLKKHMETH